MTSVETQSSHVVQLFTTKHGSVQTVVIGLEIGWRWRRVKYHRSKRSTKVPGVWDEITDDWGKHNPSLIKCALAVQKFLDTEAGIEKTIQRSWGGGPHTSRAASIARKGQGTAKQKFCPPRAPPRSM